ncbi:L-rhamnose-binding lectin CSL3-like isoform X1 [Ptychodera flava]|uniref:L-rhamnose-binding lectin CSL3-like isoform X1 n=1 Tax=Ptychodera flava TaxID=63121 RepID=UPI003969D834
MSLVSDSLLSCCKLEANPGGSEQVKIMARICSLPLFLLAVTTCTAVIHEEPDCPPDMAFVNCTLSPCDAEHVNCEADPDATCKADYCGGCVAKFYDDNDRELHCETEVGIICENKNTTIGCHNRNHVMTIKYANYGRLSEDVCFHPYGSEQLHNDTNCRAENSTEIVRNLCQGKNNCHPKVNNVVFGDPCYGVYKYLEVDFSCDTEVSVAPRNDGHAVSLLAGLMLTLNFGYCLWL